VVDVRDDREITDVRGIHEIRQSLILTGERESNLSHGFTRIFADFQIRVHPENPWLSFQKRVRLVS
jgi:hypothetical protein